MNFVILCFFEGTWNTNSARKPYIEVINLINITFYLNPLSNFSEMK